MNRGRDNQFLFWLPRILAIIFIVFLFIFSLDVFEDKNFSWQTLLNFLIHNLPSFLIIIILLIAWHREIIGGFLFIITVIIYNILVLFRINSEFYYSAFLNSLIISIPILIIGILFLFNGIKRNKD